MLFSLTYVSRAVSPMSRADLLSLLRQAREHNETIQVTGLLMYRDRIFIQVIEGPRRKVELLYASITKDPRHTDVCLVTAHDQLERQFRDWTMAFRSIGEEQVDQTGWIDLLDDDGPRRSGASRKAGEDRLDADSELVRGLLELFDRAGEQSDKA